MNKKILYIIAWFLLSANAAFATAPVVNCTWLPWCQSGTAYLAKPENIDWSALKFIWKIISEWIKYVAVIAVISLMISWIMFLISAWNDEKVKKAKKWIIWSLVWVLISTSAWTIINMLNVFTIK